ncbi:TetR/AcrR family transcriptional regulator [Actinoallomurus rhizosphaericola]|uniref:TetR/AcrR family transcriptional regulator n=1 Tax=Actinoallomurus rhizosphaericola TaxID=2952536 RepID=UPI002093DC7C|nr:TetR/AcrR family transcriptional regulator [Actinoallomurus rhizosphaericola]MCO5995515.1 TetR/AcrR family transcriptional regulator [Actinoallomurus rhizosphaericola]
MSRDSMLAAADALFADADTPQTVSMDAIAAAAGVGKGTLFRAFGDRDGLLDSLAAAKFLPLRTAVESGPRPLGPDTPAPDRIVAFLDAVLTFKLENRDLMRAREVASTGNLRSERYRWMHGLLQRLIQDAATGCAANDAGYAAHALLATLHIDLIDELLTTGHSVEDIRRAQAAQARAVLGGVVRAYGR